MNVPVELVGPVIVSLIALQAWTLKELVALKVAVATLSAKLEAQHEKEKYE